MADLTARSVRFGCTNYRGEHSTRWATPKRFWWGSTEYRTDPQGLMSAFDRDKGQMRDFALADCDFSIHGRIT